MRLRHNGLYLSPDAGGGAGAAASASAADGAGAAAATATPPASFDWSKAGLDESNLALVTDRQWKSPGDVVTSYRNLEKLTGVPADQLIRLPKDNDPKAWNEVFTKLGRPESPDKYVIKVPEGQSGDFAKMASSWFHEAGLSQSSVTKITEAWNKHVETSMAAAETQRAQEQQIQVADLQKAWGADYDKNAAVVDKFAEATGMTEKELGALKEVMGPKRAMEWLHGMGQKLGAEDKTVPGIGGSAPLQSMTADQAKAKIMELRNDKSFAALFQSQDPKQRMEAREQMDRLHKIAYPGQQTISGT